MADLYEGFRTRTTSSGRTPSRATRSRATTGSRADTGSRRTRRRTGGVPADQIQDPQKFLESLTKTDLEAILSSPDTPESLKKVAKKITKGEADGKPDGGLLGKLTNNPVTDAMGTILNVIDKPKRAVVATLDEALEEAFGYEDGNSWADNVLRAKDYGMGDAWQNAVNYENEQGDGKAFGVIDVDNKWLGRGVGLVGDIGLDPLTYIGVGLIDDAAKASGKAAKTFKPSRTEVARRALDKAAEAGKLEDTSAVARFQELAKRYGTGGRITEAEAAELGLSGGIRFAGKRIPGTDAATSTTLTRPFTKLREGAMHKVGPRAATKFGADEQITQRQLLRSKDTTAADWAAALRSKDANVAGRLTAGRFGAEQTVALDDMMAQWKADGVDGVTMGRAIKGDPDALEAVGRASDDARAWLDDIHKEAGIHGYHKDYLPRILTDEARDFLGKFWKNNKNTGGASGDTLSVTPWFEKARYADGDQFGDQVLGSPELQAKFGEVVEDQIEGLIDQWSNGRLAKVYEDDAYAVLPKYLAAVQHRVRAKHITDTLRDQGVVVTDKGALEKAHGRVGRGAIKAEKAAAKAEEDIHRFERQVAQLEEAIAQSKARVSAFDAAEGTRKADIAALEAELDVATDALSAARRNGIQAKVDEAKHFNDEIESAVAKFKKSAAERKRWQKSARAAAQEAHDELYGQLYRMSATELWLPSADKAEEVLGRFASGDTNLLKSLFESGVIKIKPPIGEPRLLTADEVRNVVAVMTEQRLGKRGAVPVWPEVGRSNWDDLVEEWEALGGEGGVPGWIEAQRDAQSLARYVKGGAKGLRNGDWDVVDAYVHNRGGVDGFDIAPSTLHGKFDETGEAHATEALRRGFDKQRREFRIMDEQELAAAAVKADAELAPLIEREQWLTRELAQAYGDEGGTAAIRADRRSVAALEAQRRVWEDHLNELYAKAASKAEKAERRGLKFEQLDSHPGWERIFQSELQENLVKFGRPDDFELWPSWMVDAYSKAGQVADDPGPFLRFVDGANKVFKTQAVLSPGFHVRNAMGAYFNNFVGGVDVRSYREFRKLLNLYRKGGIEAVPEGSRDIMRQIIDGGVLDDGNRYANEIASAADGGGRYVIGDVSSVRPQTRRAGVKATALGPPSPEKLVQRTSGKLLDSAKHPLRTLNDNPVTRTSRFAGERIEHFHRGTMAYDTLKKGGSWDGAVAKMYQFHFDYNDLSSFEMKYMRRIFPFWTWTSRNMPLQLEMALTQPKMYQRFRAVQAAMEQGSEQDPLDPTWVTGSPTSINMSGFDKMELGPFSIGGEGSYMLPDLPFQDVSDKTRQAAQTGPLAFLQDAAPILKTPLEVGFERQLFNGAPLNDELTELPAAWSFLVYPLRAATGDGVIKKNPNTGDWMISNKNAYKIEQGLPLLARFRRLAPSEDKYQQRADASWLSFLGFGTRQVTNNDRKNTAFGRADDLEAFRQLLRDLDYDVRSERTRQIEGG